MAENFYVTFGQKYRREEHPILGMVPDLPDQWVRIEAHDEVAARSLAGVFFGQQWGFLYDEASFEKNYHPKGEYGVIRMNDKTSGWVLERTEERGCTVCGEVHDEGQDPCYG